MGRVPPFARATFRSAAALALLALTGAMFALGAQAQDLTADQKDRIQIGISLIKLSCGTGVIKEDTKVNTNVDASFTLRKLPGASAGGEVTFSKSEAQALASSLQGTITAEGAHLSEVQIDCMRHYGDQIFKMLFGANEDKPAPEGTPATMTLLAGVTRPFDGYTFATPPALPTDLPPGPVLPGGGYTRIVFQARSANEVVQIDKVSVVVRKLPDPASALNYSVDPLKQSGFGAAHPRQFLVQIGPSGAASAFYITDQNKSVPVTSDNLLPKKEFPILTLEAGSGLQETLDLTLVPKAPGFYQVRFQAEMIGGGHERALETSPVYIVRR